MPREDEIDTLAPPERPAAGAAAAVAFGSALDRALRACSPDVSTARALAALSFVAPEICLELLCERADAAVAAVSTSDLSRAISVALEGFARATASRREYASRLAGRFCNILSAEAAVTILRALGPQLTAAEKATLERILCRFSGDADVLRAALPLVRAVGDSGWLDNVLTLLGMADRTPATVALVRSMRPAEPAGSRPEVRIALLGSYTLDHLAPFVDLACRRLGLRPEAYVAAPNAWERDIADDSSALRRFDPDIVFLAVSIDDLVPQLAEDPSSEILAAGGELALERIVRAAHRFAASSAGKPLVVHSFHSAFSRSLGVVDGRESPSREEWLATLNAKLSSELRALPACYVLDILGAVAASGGSLTDNPKLRHLAAMRLPPPALAGVADAYARYIAPLKGLTRKCVVVDLDNTLWGGVVGEDGKDAIRLGDTSPGSEFVELQKFLRSLSSRGILLAINSKNNADDALDVIRTHSAMVLRESDFSATRINWEPKPDNMRSIAAELNLGLDSLVFVDDNPDERELMRQLLPDVLTVELPRDAALYRSVLERLPELQTLSITSDDRQRAQAYRTMRRREGAKASAGSLDDYLKSLEIEIAIAPAERSDFARIVQLFARTNQFNVTTKRYGLADVERLAGDPGFGLWTLRSKDRFGSHGLVAVALVRRDGVLWTIDSFLMSCRVIGYGIETALLAFVAERARAAAATILAGTFVPTRKNAPARDIFARHGFIAAVASPDGEEWWQLSLARELPFPAWIARANGDA